MAPVLLRSGRQHTRSSRTVGITTEGASGFATVELKSNFMGTAREGMLDCVATLEHGRRTTQVWDAVVVERSTGRRLAFFRCTALMLYPRPG